MRGKHFIEKQEQDYERYNEYVSTIIDPAGYDTAFINRHAVEKELHRRRKNELSSYYTRWSQYQDFIKWQNEEQEKYDAYNIKQAGKLKKKLRSHDQRYRQSVSRLLATGQDTTVLGEKYRRQRKAIIASAPAYRQITAGTIPGKYQDLYLTGLQAGDIEPVMPEEEDSLRIASEHIMHERIAFNEIKGSRLEETFNRMVPAPYRPEAHYNAVIAPEYNFTYRYTRSYPVTPGLKKLRLTLKGSIMATDRSNYNIRRTDTLSYIISSMDELADTRLIANQSFTDDQRREYTNAIRLLKNREYRQALHLLNNYKDYNTALALTCLGYNSQAYNLLRQLPKTADTHYLSRASTQ
ncbi:hypothetical protein [Bacteroides sp. 224]|uniref:hypothetical protein n=1 Tax=Bacteroides sp. 224 TaxID=2302936 RepID=UPI0013D8C113|nr:hypothetical protein [Bacteroides sp. 224]